MPLEALRREIREEVGLEVNVLGEPATGFATVTAPWRVHVYSVEDHPDDGGALQHYDCLYVCTPRGNHLAGEYVDRARWVPVDAVADLETYRELPGLVADAASFALREVRR